MTFSSMFAYLRDCTVLRGAYQERVHVHMACLLQMKLHAGP